MSQEVKPSTPEPAPRPDWHRLHLWQIQSVRDVCLVVLVVGLLALDLFVASIRQYLGAYLTILGGTDAIVFSGGIGENSSLIRSGVCRNMAWAGIELDETKNTSIARGSEAEISANSSNTQIWVIPTNEEIVVARQSVEAMQNMKR